MKKLESVEKFIDLLFFKKFKVIQRNQFNWDEVLNITNDQSVYYDSGYIEFRLECLKGNEIECLDLSIGIKLENEVVAIFPLFYFKNGKDFELSFLEGSIYPPLFIKKISKKTEKEISNILIDNLIKLFEVLEPKSLIIADQLFPNRNLSIWHKTNMNRAKHCSIIRESFVDLSQDYSTLKSYYRKSYKALISKGYKLLNPFKLDQNDSKVWEEFKALHFKSAGRITRSEKSWNLLFDQVKEKNANFYFCRDHNGIMIGGSLVMICKYEAFYAVAAYDRSLFHLPIGHPLQDFIIKDLLNTQVQWYRLGRLYNKIDFDCPTDKEIQIGQFKSGFSSDLVASYRFTEFN